MYRVDVLFRKPIALTDVPLAVAVVPPRSHTWGAVGRRVASLGQFAEPLVMLALLLPA